MDTKLVDLDPRLITVPNAWSLSFPVPIQDAERFPTEGLTKRRRDEEDERIRPRICRGDEKEIWRHESRGSWLEG